MSFLLSSFFNSLILIVLYPRNILFKVELLPLVRFFKKFIISLKLFHIYILVLLSFYQQLHFNLLMPSIFDYQLLLLGIDSVLSKTS